MDNTPHTDSQPQFQLVFRSAQGLMLLLTPDLRIVDATNTYIAATLTERGSIVGRHLFDVFPDNPDDKDATGTSNLGASLKRVLETRVPDTMAVQKYDVRRPESEGGGFEERYWSPMNSPVLDAEGNVAFIIHKVEDVTEFVRLKQQGTAKEQEAASLRTRAEFMEAEVFTRAQEIQSANEKLRSANDVLQRREREISELYQKLQSIDELKSQLYANVSHELRTPLTLILGPVRKMLAIARQAGGETGDLETIERNAQLLLKHVNDLLDVAKLESGRMTAQYSRTDLARLISRCVSYFESPAHTRNIRVTFESPASFAVEIDSDKVERVAVNLLSNALKFTPDGGRIHVRLTGDGIRARLTVSDSGPGIAPADRDVVFERFRQLDGGATRKHGGTGLGLAIAKEFAELHGGSISVDESEFGGAKFAVMFPIQSPVGTQVGDADTATSGDAALWVDQDVNTNRSDLSIPTATIDSNLPDVLIVEDNPEMRRFIIDTFRPIANTLEAPHGAEALKIVRAHTPDLIVTDVMMPVMSGSALIATLRANQEFDNVPVIVLTAKADGDLVTQLLKQGAQDFLVKPFSGDELLARAQNLIRLKQSTEALDKLNRDLQDVNGELESFSYSVSHDLRSPLRGIDGFSAALEEEYADKLDDAARDYLKRIRTGAQTMGHLIDDLLTLSRAARAEMATMEIDLGLMAEEVAGELRRQSPERKVNISIQDGLKISGDARLMRIVLTNLLSNSWKYTAKHHEANIRVGSTLINGKTVYFVKDDGAGFAPEHASKIFDPFQRAHHTKDFAGTGIGLATVRRIIRRHRGQVWAEGAVEQGATVFFTLGDKPA